MKNHSEHVATENSNWYQHVSTCLNHMTAVLREKTSLVKIVATSIFAILPSGSWTTLKASHHLKLGRALHVRV